MNIDRNKFLFLIFVNMRPIKRNIMESVCLAGALYVALISISLSVGHCHAEIPHHLVNETVAGPLIDGIRLDVPKELGNQTLGKLGLVDVTSAPFDADPAGKRDATIAIQAAVNYARDHQLVCFFPSGIYLISDTISCVQNFYRRSNGKVFSARNFPCVMMGSQEGKRPVLYLKEKSPGYENRARPKYVIHFWARFSEDYHKPAPPVSMNQMFVNIDITIGKGNPGAVAIRHRGAQGSCIQGTVIRLQDGLSGIEGGCGSGGSHADVTVIGGRIGLDLRETQPAPSLTGITLIAQEEAAIVYQGRQALSAVGVNIEFAGKGIPVVNKPVRWSPFHGQISVVDSQITRKTCGPAFATESSIYLKNVYVKNISQIIDEKADTQLTGPGDRWVHIREFGCAVQPREWLGWQYSMGIYIDGEKQSGVIRDVQYAPPPYNLQSRHLWRHDFPNWETPGAINVKNPPYNAKGDGYTDDGQAIQQAIDENQIVFIPKGYYNISAPIVLRSKTQLVGVARHLSIIISRNGCRTIDSPARPVPLVKSSKKATSNNIVAFLSLHVSYATPDTYCLEWQCNGTVRDVNFDTLPPFGGFGQPRAGLNEKRIHPLFYITGCGSGKIFNFFQDDGYRFAFRPPYSHIGIEKAKGPLFFYQCNAERSSGTCNIKIRESADVSFFGLKGEGNKPVMIVENSRNVNVYGYGGNGAAKEGHSLFIVSNSPRCSFVNLVDSPRLAGEGSKMRQEGYGVNPDKWYMITVQSGKKIFKSPFLERPLVIKSELHPVYQ